MVFFFGGGARSQWNSGGYTAKEYLRGRELFSQRCVLFIHHPTCMKLH